MKKGFFLCFFTFISTIVHAYDVEIDGIYYNLIKGKAAEVTYKNDNSYSGEVVIPKKVSYEGVEYTVEIVGTSAFAACSGLTSIDIPNSVTSIGNNAFAACSGLTSIDIPNSVSSIGSYAFSNCTGLTSVTIPNSLTSIGNYAFSNCTGLTSVIIPNSVTSIGGHMFNGCTGLTSITIPNSVTSIGNGAFAACSGLTSIDIPNNVTNIEGYAFSNCTGLTSVIIPNSVTSINQYTFFGCSSLTSIDIPNSVRRIGNNAFSKCTGLTSIDIPNSVTNIEDYAFSNCTGLTSVIIPNSVTSIGGRAFAECSKLEEVYSYANKVPSTATNAFQDSYPQYIMLYVPANAINDYKTTAPWSEFGTIKSIEGVDIPKCAKPTISYASKKLTFSCATEGVKFNYEITDADIKKGNLNEVELSPIYNISVYATKSGYQNSDVAKAVIIWGDPYFYEINDNPSGIKAVNNQIPILISTNGSNITVKSETDNQTVSVYTIDGKLIGSSAIKNGQAVISTILHKGEVAIVKVGSKSAKILMQ